MSSCSADRRNGRPAQQGVVGLRDVYGLNFKDFVTLDAGGTLTMTALTNGQIQAGDLFSTDPGLRREQPCRP